MTRTQEHIDIETGVVSVFIENSKIRRDIFDYGVGKHQTQKSDIFNGQ